MKLGKKLEPILQRNSFLKVSNVDPDSPKRRLQTKETSKGSIFATVTPGAFALSIVMVFSKQSRCWKLFMNYHSVSSVVRALCFRNTVPHHLSNGFAQSLIGSGIPAIKVGDE
jgi:hypothetical protein